MNYQDYYLKFPDEETQKKFYDPENHLVIEDFYFRIIGIMFDEGEMVTEEKSGYEYRELIPKEGWHANVRSKLPLPDNLKPYQIFPVSPSEVWL